MAVVCVVWLRLGLVPEPCHKVMQGLQLWFDIFNYVILIFIFEYIICVTVLADFSESPRLRHLQLVATKALIRNKQLAQYLKQKAKYDIRPRPASRSNNMSLTVNVCLLQRRLLTSSDTSSKLSAACMTEPVYCCYKLIAAGLITEQSSGHKCWTDELR